MRESKCEGVRKTSDLRTAVCPDDLAPGNPTGVRVALSHESDLLRNCAYSLIVAMCIFNRSASLRSANFDLYLTNVTMPTLAHGFDPPVRLVHAFILFLGLIGIV